MKRAIMWSQSADTDYIQTTHGKYTAAVWQAGGARPWRMIVRLASMMPRTARVRCFGTKDNAIDAAEAELRERAKR